MYKLFSERIRNKDGEPEVYIYDEFPETFRNQVFYIMVDILDELESCCCEWNDLHDEFCREKGLKFLGDWDRDYREYGRHNCEQFISETSNADFLDFIDFVFFIFNGEGREVNIPPYYHNMFAREIENKNYDTIMKEVNNGIDEAIEELNYRFKQHNLGYEFVNGEIIRIDNKIIHQEIVKPALRLLYEEGFDGAEEEFRKAFEYRRKGDNKNAILEAGKSFESTMKTICDKKGYTYDKAKDTAKQLINILESNNFYPSYMSSHMANLRTTLESGLPVVRNKTSGHGQGSTVTPISDEFAEYALNLTATNIVLLVGIYKRGKEGECLA